MRSDGKVETLFWMEDQLKATGMAEVDVVGWLGLGHLVHRRRVLTSMVRHIGGQALDQAVARSVCEAVAQQYMHEEAEGRWDTQRPTGGFS